MTLEQNLACLYMQRHDLTRDGVATDIDRERLQEIDLAIHAATWKLDHEPARETVSERGVS